MKIHTLLARAIAYAIEDRRALIDAHHGEGAICEETRIEVKQLRALHEKLKITPARRLVDVMLEDVPSVDVLEIKRQHEAERALTNSSLKQSKAAADTAN